MRRNRNDRAHDFTLGRLSRMAVTRGFVDAYRAIANDRQILERLQECINDLWMYPRPHGLNEEGLSGRGRHRLWSARIDQSWRLIFLVPKPDEVILVYVGKHDIAYEWANTHVRDGDRLKNQASTVDPDMKIADAVAGFGLPSAEETARAARSAAEFAAMCDRGLETYFTTLDPSQHDLVAMNPVGNFLALGGPGTGKTVIAIHRVARHLQDGKRVAYVCFNRPLFQATQQMIETVAPGTPDRLGYVGTTQDLCLRIINTIGGSASRPAKPEVFEGAVDEAIRMLPEDLKKAVLTTKAPDAAGRLAQWKPRDVADEIGQVIMACHVRDLDEYLTVDRSWRGGRLTAEARRGVWQACQAASKALDDQALIPWDDLPRRAADALRNPKAAFRPFAEIVIDEIQDIAPAFIDFARLLLDKNGGRIFALGDPEQGVYGRPIKLALDRVSPHKHDRRWLARDYRSTRQGWRLAESWRVIERDTDTVRECEIAPDRDGPAPRLIVEADQDAAFRALVDAVANEATNTEPGMIGVLHLGSGTKIADALQARGIEAVIVDGTNNVRFADPVVKVVSIRRSKGLDFPSLFILLPERQDASRDPITWADRETSDEARRVLYVAATRASRNLVLAMGIDAPHPLIESLAPSSYRAEGTRGGHWRMRVGGEDPEDPKPATPAASEAPVVA